MRNRGFRLLTLLMLAVFLFGCRPAPEPASPTATEEATLPTETDGKPDREAAYTSKDDVARYLFAYGTLPKNYMTKSEARERGWDSGAGNLRDIAEDAVIGGDVFRNFEKQLPEKKGRKWFEADVNYEGGHRGAERLVYSNDGLIYYTKDHYKTFVEWKPEDTP